MRGDATGRQSQTTNTPIYTHLNGLTIGLILDDAALLDDVGEARLIQRQQTILGCSRFHGHLDQVENGAGGGTWLREGSLRKSSRLRQSG